MEALEVVLVETQLRLLRYEVGNKHRRARTNAGILEFLHEALLLYVEHIAQAHSIKTRLVHIAIDNHQVVTLHTLHEELAITVNHLATRRILHLVT